MVQSPSLAKSHVVDANLVPTYWDDFQVDQLFTKSHEGNPMLTSSGWWFETFFIFPYIGNNHPN